MVVRKHGCGLGAVVAAVAVVFSSLVGSVAHAQRLPDTVRPEHYSLTLTPDLQAATFTGDETIDVVLSQPAQAITLNAAEIKFEKVAVEAAGKTLPAQVALDPGEERATFTFPSVVPAGPATLKITYSGILNNQLRGFYLSKTAKRNYAVTQFEATDARRAFPSWDEPDDKATYDIHLVVAKGDTAISNTNIVADQPGPAAGTHTISFATTPKMSTYLVAFLVGDFQCISGQSDGVPIRSCATPGQEQYGRFALSAAEYVLHYYDTYFGIKYPMPKLDMIALPDFEAGAMENFGAITYRETDMLIDDKNASVATKKNVALVVAHEMAHQWFGDMVTMRWWDNIWLNEGFATWMEHKPVAAWKPEWNIPQDVAADLNGTLNLDAQKVTRTIRARADTPEQIAEMFDGITYGKAGAVLLMVENYLGEETFRKGVHNYLQAHIYGNATAEDFWSAQTATSGKPVDKIMESFVEQPGEPLLRFGPASGGEGQGGKVQVSQTRFYLNPTVAPEARVWTLPVCVKSTSGAPACDVLTGASQTLTLPGGAPFFYADAGGKGYYRSEYDKGDYERLVSHVEDGLQPTERISLLGDEWALTRADKASVADYMTLASAVKQDTSPAVIATVAGAIGAVDESIASSEEEHRQLAEWVRKNFAPALQRMGPATSAATPQQATPEQQELRATLTGLVGGVGGDPQVIAQAKETTQRYLANPASVESTQADTALLLAAAHGDAALYDQLQRVSETSTNPQLKSLALASLAVFRDPALVRRTLDYAASGRVRNQDSVFLISRELRSRHTNEVAWQYLQQNWPKVQAQLTKWGGGALVQSAGNFCSADRKAEVTSFFTEHKVAAAQRALQQAQDRIDGCVQLRASQGANLRQWLEGTGSGQAHGGSE